jgi:hemerythrin
MAYMTLSGAYNIGLPSIDGEHAELMDLINQIHEGLHAHASQDELKKLFQRLTDCASTHFWREEMQFVETGYPDAAIHTHKHEHLMMILSCFQSGVDRTGRAVSVEDQLGFLRDWLLDHIDNEDRQLGNYLAARKRAA